MKLPSRYATISRDANEPELVQFAKQLGGHWLQAPPLDGWLFYQGAWRGPIEIKLPEREGLKYEYTAAQKRFFSWAELRRATWIVWRTQDDVLKTLNARRSA